MVVINIAYTAAINPSDAPFALTQDQVWAGLRIFSLRPTEFVPAIVDCEILEAIPFDCGDKITRIVTYAEGSRLKKDRSQIKELCYHYNSNLAVYYQDDGSTIYNIVSKDRDGNLLLTYSFEWRHPDVPEGSEEAKSLEEYLWGVAKISVESSIRTFRRLVQEGEIG